MLNKASNQRILMAKNILTTSILFAFALVFITSCSEISADKRFLLWSPDGQYAIFKNDNSIRVMDDNGKLHDFSLDAELAVWCPDNRNFVAVCREKIKTWEEFKSYLDEKTQNQIVEGGKFFSLLSKKYKDSLAEKLDKDALSTEDQVKLDELEKTVGFQSIVTYLYFNDSETLSMFFPKDKKEKEIAPENKIEEQKAPENEKGKQTVSEEFIDLFMPRATSIKLYNISKNSIDEKRLLYKEATSIVSMAVSPGNDAIAFVESEEYRGEDQKKLNGKVLKVIPLQGKKKAVVIAKNVKDSIDWHKKNNFLVFLQDRGSLDELCWADVIDKNGKFNPEPKIEDIVDLSYANEFIKCTNDGAVFFKTTERTYPQASKQEKNTSASLFLIDPLKFQSVVKITSCISDYTDISPDGKRVCNLWCDGTVSVFELPTADEKDIQEKKLEKKIYESVCIKPTFRTNSEISYTAPLEKPKGEQIAKVVVKDLASGKVKTLSKRWPDELSEFLLKPKEEEEEDKTGKKYSEAETESE